MSSTAFTDALAVPHALQMTATRTAIAIGVASDRCRGATGACRSSRSPRSARATAPRSRPCSSSSSRCSASATACSASCAAATTSSVPRRARRRHRRLTDPRASPSRTVRPRSSSGPRRIGSADSSQEVSMVDVSHDPAAAGCTPGRRPSRRLERLRRSRRGPRVGRVLDGASIRIMREVTGC